MKRSGIFFLTVIMLIALLNFAGCGQEKGGITGKWAYIHDPDTVIINLKSNGNAVYKGDKYKYTYDDEFITLKSNSKEVKLRYTKDDKEFYLFEPCEYTYMDEGTPEGIVGNWYDYSTKWSYEFTEDGTFMEDGYFPGYYTADEAEGTIKLVYNDHFYDTTLYYSLTDGVLHIEYPWSMVRAN